MKILIFATLIFGVISASLPAAQNYSRNWGWSGGRVVSFYTFTNGNFSKNGVVETAPIWFFRSTNDSTATALQNNLINVVPGDSGYSDLWQVNVVVVTDTSIIPVTSLTALNSAVSAGKATINAWTTTVNCPVVGSGSTLDPADSSKYPLTQGYYMGNPVFYFDFGTNPATTQPIYHLVIVGTKTVVDGIFATVPTDSSYTAFWIIENVPVASNYQNGTYTSTSQVSSAGVDQKTLVNCPIVYVATSVTGNTTAKYSAPSSAHLISLSIVLLLISLALILI
jgi:hypothetical protein